MGGGGGKGIPRLQLRAEAQRLNLAVLFITLQLFAAERQAEPCSDWLPFSDVTAAQPINSVHSKSIKMNCNSQGPGN